MGRIVKCPQGSRLWLRIIKWDQYLTRPLRAQTHTHTHNLHRFFPYQFLSRLPSLSSQPFTRSRHILAFSGTVIFFYKMFIKSFPLQHCHLVFAAALHFPFPIFSFFFIRSFFATTSNFQRLVFITRSFATDAFNKARLMWGSW